MLATRIKILAYTKIKQTVLVTYLTKGITNEYPSAGIAAEVINVSNYTIMNILKGKNNKLYKCKDLITRFSINVDA
jgi:hypothetical protein